MRVSSVTPSNLSEHRAPMPFSLLSRLLLRLLIQLRREYMQARMIGLLCLEIHFHSFRQAKSSKKGPLLKKAQKAKINQQGVSQLEDEVKPNRRESLSPQS